MHRFDKSALERQCCELIETALARDPNNHEVYRLSSKTYKNMHKWAQAKDCLQDGLKNCEEKVRLHQDFGRFYTKSKHPHLTLAKYHLEQAIELEVHKGRYLVSAELELIKINIRLSSYTEPYDPVDDLIALDMRAPNHTGNVLKIEIQKVLADWFLSKNRPEEALAEYLDAANLENRSITDRLDVSIVDKIEQLLLER